MLQNFPGRRSNNPQTPKIGLSFLIHAESGHSCFASFLALVFFPLLIKRLFFLLFSSLLPLLLLSSSSPVILFLFFLSSSSSSLSIDSIDHYTPYIHTSSTLNTYTMLPLTVLLSLVAVTSAGNYSLPKEFDVNKVELGTRCMSVLLTLLYISHTDIRDRQRPGVLPSGARVQRSAVELPMKTCATRYAAF